MLQPLLLERADGATESCVTVAGGLVEAVHAVLSVPDGELDYARTKLALDSLIDPTLDASRTMAELDQLADSARRLAGADAIAVAKLTAVRTVIYEAGPWNGGRPFAYDHSDPFGKDVRNKLLANYLSTRRGQCVSMPILFLIVADRLGLNVALATAPHHVFLRFTDERGRALNIEATSGGHPAPDPQYRRNFPMTDRALENGLYMRTLSRREAVALMATTVLQHLMTEKRYEEVAAVSRVILPHNPRDVHVLLWEASAYAEMIQREFAAKYPVPFLIPEPARSHYRMLCARNEALFGRAEALGWQPDPTWEPPRIAAFPEVREMPLAK